MFDRDRLELIDVLNPEFVEMLYNMVVKENGFDTYFYNISEEDYSAEKFVKMMEGRNITVANYNNKIAGFVILEPIFGNTIGSVSYYGFEWIRTKYAVGIGVAYIEKASKHFNTLVGLSPINNKISIAFNKKIGLKEVGIIKNACWIEKDRMFVDGLLTSTGTK